MRVLCPKCLEAIELDGLGIVPRHKEMPGLWCGMSGADLSQYAKAVAAMLDAEREELAQFADKIAASAEQTIKDFPDAKIKKCRERISTANLIAGFARDRKGSK